MRLGQVLVTTHFPQAAFGAPEFKFMMASLIQKLRLVFRAEDGVDTVVVEFVDEVNEAVGGIVHVLAEYGYAGDEYVVKAACDLTIVLAGAGTEAEGVEVEPHRVVGAVARGDLAVLDGDGYVRGADVGRETLEVVEHALVALLAGGREIGVRLFQVTQAVIHMAGEIRHRQGRVDELDGGQEAFPLQAVTIQFHWRQVGGEDQGDAALEQGVEQAVQYHGIADVFHIELVQA